MRIEKEKRDYYRQKAEEKYSAVLTKKRDIDRVQEAKMAELARKAAEKARGRDGLLASASARALDRELAEIPVRGEAGWEDDANRDVVDTLQQTTAGYGGKNVNFELARPRSGSNTQMLSRTHLG